jgi:hypothetical protein
MGGDFRENAAKLREMQFKENAAAGKLLAPLPCNFTDSLVRIFS